MAFGLSFQAKDSMIANNFVIAQLDAEEDSEQPFANEQERLAMARVLHDYKIAYETNGTIDLEKLFYQLGSIFKPEVESTEDDSLQAAMMAHARMQPRPVHQDKGNHMGPKKKQDTRQGSHESPRLEKHMQVMYNMKAEMGSLRRALHVAGICVEAPYNKKNKEQPINGRQKPKFAGIAKRANRSKKVASKSLVPDQLPTSITDTDSEDEPHESSNMAVAVKRKVPINPRALSADLHGMTRSYHVRARAMAEEHADLESGAEDFEARESFGGGGSDDELQEYRPTFDHFSTRDAMAEELEHDINSPTVEDDDKTLSKEREIDDDQGSDSSSEATADETVKEPNPRRKTRSQGKKAFNIPAAASPSDLENEPRIPKRHICPASQNSFHPPQVRARQRSLRPGRP